MLERMKAALGKDQWTALKEISNSEPEDPFRVLIGTILSHRTRDERTAEATARLFKRYRNASELAAAPREDVEDLIRSVGFYRVKSRRIIEVAKIIQGQYGGKVPDTIEDLMELPSVGRKTANCVLVYGFRRDAIPVDTHVHRIANRLGIVKTSKPDETEEGLIKFFSRDDWKEVNDLFVSYGKSICRPVGPRCGICPLTADCNYFQNVVKTKNQEIV